MKEIIDDITFCEDCPYHGEPNGCNRKEGECKAYYAFLDLTAENDRLTAENAKIDEYKCVIADISEQCKELEAENDKLRAKLAKAVELKAEVEDTLYMPWVYGGTYGIAKLRLFAIDFRKSEVVYITDLQSDNVNYLKKYKFGIFRNEDFDNMVFTDYDKAEAKLKELQGGADNG